MRKLFFNFSVQRRFWQAVTFWLLCSLAASIVGITIGTVVSMLLTLIDTSTFISEEVLGHRMGRSLVALFSIAITYFSLSGKNMTDSTKGVLLLIAAIFLGYNYNMFLGMIPAAYVTTLPVQQ